MTHKQIAKIAHVSTSTVSKALSDSKEISNELSEKIKEIAAKTGYFEEKRIRRTEYKKSQEIFIALICPEIISIEYSRYATQMQQMIENMGGHCAVFQYDFDIKKLDSIIDALNRKIMPDGIVLMAGEEYETECNIPIVTFSSATDSKADSIYSDNYETMSMAIKYLKDLGHTNIGYAGEKHTSTKNINFVRAMNENGLLAKEEFIYIVNKRFEEIGYSAAEKIINQKSRPTAIISAYDEIAIGMMQKLSDNGIKVPDDISLMGLNDIPYAKYCAVPLTSIRFFSEEKCKICAELIYDKILNKNHSVKHIKIMPVLVERKSVKKISRA